MNLLNFMPLRNPRELNIKVPGWMLKRRTNIIYNGNPLLSQDRDVAENLAIAPDDKFYEFLAKHMNAYLDEGTTPPVEITTAILNISEDFLTDKIITMRTGDYVALQSYFRKNK